MSTKMKNHVEYLKSLYACEDAVIEAAKYDTLQEAWDKSERGDWMLWLLGKQSAEVGSPSRRKLVFTAAQCAKLALPYTKDARVAACIEACEAYAKGSISLEDLRTAADVARAAEVAADAAADAAAAARSARAAWVAAWSAAAAWAAAWSADAAAWAAGAEEASVLKQCAAIVRESYPKVELL